MRSPLSRSTSISIPRLRGQVNGRATAPDDRASDQARMVFTGGFDRRRLSIVQAAGHDVARVVALAGESGKGLSALCPAFHGCRLAPERENANVTSSGHSHRQW